MQSTLVGALLGLLVGTILGGFVALAVYRLERRTLPENGWTNPAVNQPAGAVLWQHIVSGPPLSTLMFHGDLLGGGFGAVVGTIVAATSLIVRTLDRTRPE